MAITTTAQTSDLQVNASITGQQYINRFLYKYANFAPEIINLKGEATGMYNPDGSMPKRPRLVNLSQYFGRNLQKGSTIRVPEQADRFYAERKHEGVPFTPQVQNYSYVDLTITDMFGVLVEVEDYQQNYNNIENFNSVIKNGMNEAIVQAIEERIFALFPQATNVTGSGATQTFDTSSLRTAKIAMDKRNVPGNLGRYAFLAPEHYSELGTEHDEYQLFGEKGAKIRETGRVYKMIEGFNIFQSNHIPIIGGAAKMAAFTDDAFMFGVGYQPRFETARRIENSSTQMLISVLFGAGIKRQEYIQQLNYDDTNNL